MNDSKPDPAQLQTRFHMLDLMAGVILPACVTSAWPVENPEQRLAVFFPALGLGICSAWWTATLIHTLKIRRWIMAHGFAYLRLYRADLIQRVFDLGPSTSCERELAGNSARPLDRIHRKSADCAAGDFGLLF